MPARTLNPYWTGPMALVTDLGEPSLEEVCFWALLYLSLLPLPAD